MDKLHYLKAERNAVADALSRVRLQCKEATATDAIGIWMAEQEDVADTLPTEGSQYVIEEEVLVDHTFLQQLVRFSRLTRHSLSCYIRLQISGMHKNTISHCRRTGLLITVLRLLDSNQT